jgi:hypothetical protein
MVVPQREAVFSTRITFPLYSAMETYRYIIIIMKLYRIIDRWTTTLKRTIAPENVGLFALCEQSVPKQRHFLIF